MERALTCASCGASLVQASRFCSSCGVAVRSDPVASVAAAADEVTAHSGMKERHPPGDRDRDSPKGWEANLVGERRRRPLRVFRRVVVVMVISLVLAPAATLAILYGFTLVAQEMPEIVDGVAEAKRSLIRDGPSVTPGPPKRTDCDWSYQLNYEPDSRASRCANLAAFACPQCGRGKWFDLGYSSVSECSDASIACLNDRCAHLCD